MFQEKIDILFTPPSPLATSVLGKLCLRKTRIVLFGQKNQWKPILRATVSGFSNFYRR